MKDYYPLATLKLLNYDWNLKTTITPTQVIEHTAVASASSLWPLFETRRKDPDPNKRTFSHAYINADGVFEQYAPFNKKSAAQWDGNLHGISVETWDGGVKVQTPQGLSLPPLNDAQLKTYIEFCKWAVSQGVEPRLCPGPQASGFGYHRQFQEWNKANHSCPDPAKIFQLVNVIIPALQEPLPEPIPVPKEEDEEMDLLKGVVDCYKYQLNREPDRPGLAAWLTDAQNKVDAKIAAGCNPMQASQQAITELNAYFSTLPEDS